MHGRACSGGEKEADNVQYAGENDERSRLDAAAEQLAADHTTDGEEEHDESEGEGEVKLRPVGEFRCDGERERRPGVGHAGGEKN